MRSGTLWLAMLNPLLSLAMSILLLSLVLKRNFFMRMEKCGTATNHSSKQAKLDWRTGNIGERKKCSWPNPVAQNTRDPFFAHPIFFSFSICHSFFHLSYMMLQTPFWKHWNLCLFLSEGWTNFRIEWAAFLTKCICHWYQIKILVTN